MVANFKIWLRIFDGFKKEKRNGWILGFKASKYSIAEKEVAFNVHNQYDIYNTNNLSVI
jgi:hypothetical protein